MKQFNWVKVLILDFVTCGIYSLYLWFKMTSNNNALAKKVGIPTITNFFVAFLLGYVTCGIYPIVWNIKFFRQQIAIAETYGIKTTPARSAFVLFILSFVPVYSFYVICTNYNRTVAAAEAFEAE